MTNWRRRNDQNRATYNWKSMYICIYINISHIYKYNNLTLYSLIKINTYSPNDTLKLCRFIKQTSEFFWYDSRIWRNSNMLSAHLDDVGVRTQDVSRTAYAKNPNIHWCKASKSTYVYMENFTTIVERSHFCWNYNRVSNHVLAFFYSKSR